MRTLGIAAAVVLGLLAAGVGGYQLATYRYSHLMEQRVEEKDKDISLLLSMIADIADHRSRDEHELADWKFETAHEQLESHVRAGGPRPAEFVLDIVEVDQLPADEEDDDEDEPNEG